MTRAAVEVTRARLEVRDPSGGVQSLSLALDEQVVGSDPGADLIVTDPAVSRRHFSVRLMDDGVRVRDLGSSNGLFVDRVRVVDGYCPVGAILAFGRCRGEVVGKEDAEDVDARRLERLDLPLKAARALVVASFERRYVRAKVASTGGNLTQAAALMGISRQYLYRLIEQHGLQVRDDDSSTTQRSKRPTTVQ